MTSHERHGVSNHQLIDCFLKRKTKKTTKVHIVVNCEVAGGFSHNRSLLQKTFPCHEVYMKSFMMMS